MAVRGEGQRAERRFPLKCMWAGMSFYFMLEISTCCIHILQEAEILSK